ncbi:hypothetical protein V9T40_009301 [Parthenolecanium corni]|uniref:Transmembrane protein adipocyte-associated 1 n=1 Tax=Parthenolecanium corni TaxID=536013 RepID=A0AAN9TMH4_9HEMI
MSDLSLLLAKVNAPVVVTTTITSTSPDDYLGVADIVDNDYVCRTALYMEIPNTKIRLWDTIILIPNLMFLLFLIIGFDKARLKLRATNSPIFLTFYCLVFINVVLSITRCIISVLVNSSSSSLLVRSYADIGLWIVVQLFSMITELSVIIFGLAFGHLDSRSSISHVLLVTSLFSLAFSICQAALEILLHDQAFRVSAGHFGSTDGYDLLLFGHGGAVFWFASSIIFSMLYSVIIVLPWTSLREKLALPAKRSFYIYASVLMLLNVCCVIGSGLLLLQIDEGLCIVDLTTGLYSSFFAPLVYYIFLSNFFDVSQPNLQFSYKGQTDDTPDDDNLSLPHHHSFASLKTDSDYIYRTSDMYENTHFNTAGPINPLYVASLQSPDSITGYSLDSQIFDLPSTSKP